MCLTHFKAHFGVTGSPGCEGARRRQQLHKKGFALHVLFVCTGNICRSPTAERLALAYSAGSNFENFTASSAGTRAVTGHPIEPVAACVLEKLGGDASDFAARR